MVTLRAVPDATAKAAPTGRRARWEPPEWLSAPAKSTFRRLLIDIEEAFPEVLGRLDVNTLALLSENFAIAQAAARAMRGPGNIPQVIEVDEAHRDRHRKTPAWQVFREAMSAYAALAREYGLTLGSRLRLDLDAGAPIGVDEDEDDLEALLGD